MRRSKVRRQRTVPRRLPRGQPELLINLRNSVLAITFERAALNLARTSCNGPPERRRYIALAYLMIRPLDPKTGAALPWLDYTIQRTRTGGVNGGITRNSVGLLPTGPPTSG